MTQIFLKTYHRLHIYDIESEHVQCFTGRSAEDAPPIPELENKLAPVYTKEVNCLFIFGVKCKLAVSYREEKGMRINLARSGKLIRLLFKGLSVAYITDLELVRKLQTILKHSSKYFVCHDCRTSSGGTITANNDYLNLYYNLWNSDDGRMINQDYNYYQVPNKFCSFMRSELINLNCIGVNHLIDNLHFRNFMIWYITQAEDPGDLTVVKTRLGMYYIRSERGFDPFINIPNKYDFVSAVVGYKVRKGISPEVRTEEDARLVITQLKRR